MDWEQMKGEPYSYFTYGVCCCEVELDCLTGEYRVRVNTNCKHSALITGFYKKRSVCLPQTLRTDLVMDIGRSVNPSVDIGQV